MAIETELKLRIAPEHLIKLRRHPLFKTHQLSRPISRRLHNIYFDTPTLQLHARKMALRLRRSRGQWWQTLKGGGSVKAGLHQRNEWEIPVSSAQLDFSNLETAVWDEQLPPDLRAMLTPVFVTDFYRSSRLLLWHGAEIELCIDHGEVKTAHHSTPICEIELELKSGEPQQLFELAMQILAIVPFEMESVSKAERGFHLLSGYVAQAAKSEPLSHAATDSLGEILQTVIWSCLSQIQRNAHGALYSDDAEYLHQMRVGLRRLRVALRMANKLRPDTTLSALRLETAALGRTLGKIREWDVFIEEIAQHQTELLATSQRLRADCSAALRDVESARSLQHLWLRFALWMNSGYWQTATDPRHFASLYLKKLAKRYAKSTAHLDSHDMGQLHLLRIMAKKIRYGTEFFATLYEPRSVRVYLTALSQLQDVLGEMHDLATAHNLLAELASDPALSAQISCVAHSLDKKTAAKRKILAKILHHFDKQPAFW